ncbi:lipid II:glycine glycyltransferase FemX [Cetobacterium somerae]
MGKKNKDIYFIEEYGKIFEKNGEGSLETFYFENDIGSVLYRYLKREIPMEVEGEKYYDTITPYGYGGPIILEINNIENKDELIKEFNKELEKKFESENIVSSFLRFHPLLKNEILLKNNFEIEYNRDTIAINLESENVIWDNIHSKCRNMIRKAEKNNIQIEIKSNVTEAEIEEFYNLYRETMIKNNAIEYYLFSKNFFINTFKLLGENIKLVNAVYENKIISSAIILEYGDYLHYHFSGSNLDFKKLAATNFLIYKVALYGCEKKIKYFHLGGGYLGNEDSLFKFKQSFNKNEKFEFFIGKKIYNEEIYTKLVNQLLAKNKIIQENFFPKYRQ